MSVCRRIGGRRYRVRALKYRFHGQRKRRLLLTGLHASRKARARQTKPATKCPAKPTLLCQLITWTCGLLGVRVGEASHPGPGHSNKRKAQEEVLTDDSDVGLASALLDVLQKFQNGSNPQNVRSEPPANKKGKGGQIPAPKGSKLARVLWQTLQAALTQGWTDQQVAQRLITKINKHVPTREGETPDAAPPATVANGNLSNTKKILGEKVFERIEKSAKDQAGKVTGMILELPVAKIKGLLADETALQSTVADALETLQQRKPRTWTDRARTSPTSGPFANDKGKSKGKGKPRDITHSMTCAMQIKPLEWSGQPTLTNLTKLEQALTDGNDPPGNLIISKDPDMVNKAKSMWAAYACSSKCLTVGIVSDKPSTSVSVCVFGGERKERAKLFHHSGSSSRFSKSEHKLVLFQFQLQ